MSKLLSTAVNPLYQDGRLTDAGITKRELFAMACMQAMICDQDRAWEIETMAEDAIKFADGLLLELNKEVAQ